jgi:methylase of polypeptide subunit release factors
MDIESYILEKIDVVISNPPYVPFDEIYLLDDASYYEPSNAIFISNPVDVYFDIANKFLGKKIYFEINPSISSKLKKLGKLVKDINGKDRFLIIE